jgi:hypothetical protein
MFKYPDLRAKSRIKNHVATAARCAYEDAIVDQIAQSLARPSFVIHETESKIVHIDVHVVAPAPAHDFWFLFTTGMSALPMKKPRRAPGSRFAELSLLLPAWWKVDRESWRDTRWFWPIRELRAAALLPHRRNTWLSSGHTIGSAAVHASPQEHGTLDPSTRLTTLLVLASDANTIHIANRDIDLMTLIPIYPEELAYKADHGLDALLDAFEEARIENVIDPSRVSAVPPRN